MTALEEFVERNVFVPHLVLLPRKSEDYRANGQERQRESVCCPRTTNNPREYANGRVAGSQLHTRFPNCQGSKTMVLVKTKGIQVKG